jgi:hypothetical protein
MKNCPYCNAEIEDNSLFCGICGKKLPANQFCVKCGNKRNGLEKYCPKCGTPYDSSEPKDDSIKEMGHNSKSKSGLWIATVIGLIIVLLGCCIWYFALRKDYSLEGLAKVVQKYEIICNFKDGLAEVCKDGKWGFIDKNGNEVIPCKYDPIEDSDNGFFEGLAVVMTNNYEKFHVINKKGDIAFTHSYSWVSKFSEGLSLVSKNSKMGYIDTSGKEVIPCTYDLAYEFSEGMAIVYKGNKYGFIDTKGNVVIPFEYETDEEIPTGFHDGLACVYKNGKYGYIDKKGNVVVSYKYDIAYPFSEGMAVVAKKVASDVYRYGYIDTSGNEVIKCEYRDANSFSEGYASVKKVADYMFIDKNGKEMFSCSYYNVGSFHEGLARVTTKTDDNFLSGFIDKSGNEIIPCIYDCYEDFSEGLVVVSKDGVYGYVDSKGNSTFDFQNGDVNAASNEKKQKEEEEERKRQEEEKEPDKRFYEIAKQGIWVWGCKFSKPRHDGDDLYTLFFYIRPRSESTGEINYVEFNELSFSDYIGYQRLSSIYSISDNVLIATLQSDYFPGKFLKDGDNIALQIVNDGEKVKLVEIDSQQDVTWLQMEPVTQKGRMFKDPPK